ncbi:uncharacterized protein EDB91DRAFT_1130369 [Suillus paluster]|uniref:uncharacterized protein n=1 Tax=Suillus paluster TaxID=48578 RepID=UPI001B879E43|nr:uncharacterized protein EDB91DRAFT_1130369 [Suillus paluster]KAG1741431.1 hypothetical protein EDB91DRAFT_1130369 [Suillus paluster]
MFTAAVWEQVTPVFYWSKDILVPFLTRPLKEMLSLSAKAGEFGLDDLFYLTHYYPAMRNWLSLALALATRTVPFTDPFTESLKPSYAPSQCRAHAWVRAPDMMPGDVIAGDIKIKLNGPCPDAESYALGLRYKERIFWKLRREDAPIPKGPKFKYNSMESNRDLIQVPLPFQNSVQNQDLWSVHEEERIAFEIKAPLSGAEVADPLSRSFTTRFGILVPNTNYPPGLDYRSSGMPSWRSPDTISSESIYEYFVEIKFSNGTTSEIPAGITAFTPFYRLTEKEAPDVNVSLARAGPGSNMKLLEPLADMLRSNYTIEVSFPDGAHVYQNSSVNITATVHRSGYTNRTDTPVRLCALPTGPSTVECHSHWFIKTLVPSAPFMHHPQFAASHALSHSPCKEIKFAAAPADLTHEGHITSMSSEPLLLSLYTGQDAIPDFSTYYRKLENRINLRLHVKPDPSEPWEHESEKNRWEKQTEDMDESDLDWVPWLSPKQTRITYFEGDANLSIIPMQKCRLMRSTPIHYLSDEARQPTFVKMSDIADLRRMSSEERDLLAPFAQPSIKVFAEGEELPNRYFTAMRMGKPIYVGDTWTNKVAAEGQRERDTMDHLLVVQ